MEQVESQNMFFTEEEKHTLADLWRGKRLAIVDDDTDDMDFLPDLFSKQLGLSVVSSSREMAENPDSVVIQEFSDPSGFIAHLRSVPNDFDVCILDGKFNYADSLTGPEAVYEIKDYSPQTLIIGRSNEARYNRKFENMINEGLVEAVIPKSRTYPKVFPDIAKSILFEEHEDLDY